MGGSTLPESMTRTIRQLRAELTYLHYSRYLLVVLGVVVLGVVVATTGSVSNAYSSHHFFLQQVELFEANGITLADALDAPVAVVTEGSRETIDNPLKYDYLQVGESISAVRGTALIGTALDLVTFVVAPLLFLMMGAHIANYDRTSHTAALRASRDRWTTVTAGKALSLGVVALLAAVTTALVALAASLATAPAVRDLTGSIAYELMAPDPVAPVALKLAMTTAVSVFFGVIGYAIGWLTRSSSWSMVLAAAVLFLVPFVSPWDPRNLIATLGQHVYDFWGQFELHPPLPVDPVLAGVAIGGYLLAALAVLAFSARRVRLR